MKRGRTGGGLTWKQHWQRPLKAIPAEQFTVMEGRMSAAKCAHKHALYIHALTKAVYRPSTPVHTHRTHTHTIVLLAVIRVQCVFLSGVIHQSDGCQ